MTISDYIREKGIVIMEGGSSKQQTDWFVDFIVAHPTIKYCLEIGFNGGHWADAVLGARPDIKLTSVDIGNWDYVYKCKEYIDSSYPNRHTLVVGDSTKVIPTLTECFDLIFIDGGHAGDVPYLDIKNCKKVSHSATHLIVDDFNTYHGKQVFTGWQKASAEGYFTASSQTVNLDGRDLDSPHCKAWWVGQYKPINYLIINSYNRDEYLGRCLESLSKSDDLNRWSIVYHQDGLKTGGFCKKTAAVANKWLDVCQNRGVSVVRHFYDENKNIGIRQYDAIIDAFERGGADYLVIMEDDTIPSTTYLNSMFNMLEASKNMMDIGFVSGNYNNKLNVNNHLSKFKLLKLLWKCPQITWLTGHSKRKFNIIKDTYKEAHRRIFANRPYQPPAGQGYEEYLKLYDAVFDELGLERNTCYCQDVMMGVCYNKYDMRFCLMTPDRNSLPIGKIGIHFNEAIFDKFYDSTTNDWQRPTWVDDNRPIFYNPGGPVSVLSNPPAV